MCSESISDTISSINRVNLASPRVCITCALKHPPGTIVKSSVTIVFNMTNDKLTVNLTIPNGQAYTQPTGLFIDNEFVHATSGRTITSIDPA